MSAGDPMVCIAFRRRSLLVTGESPMPFISGLRNHFRNASGLKTELECVPNLCLFLLQRRTFLIPRRFVNFTRDRAYRLLTQRPGRCFPPDREHEVRENGGPASVLRIVSSRH